jgi:hypothetical protein
VKAMNAQEKAAVYYNENIVNQEENYRKLKRKIVIKRMIATLIFILLMIIIIMLTGDEENEGEIGGITLIGYLAYMYVQKRKFIDKAKKEIIIPAMQYINPEITVTDIGLPEHFIYESEMFKYINRYSSEDGISGIIGETEYELSEVDAKHKTGSGKNSHITTIFKGVFVVATLKESTNVEIIIKPDYKNKFINSVLRKLRKVGVNGNRIVALENAEFERYFEVYSEDQIRARMVLTTAFMERLVEFYNIYKKKMHIKIKDNIVYIGIWNAKVIDDNYVYREGLIREAVFKNLNMMEEIIKSLELLAKI